MPGRGKRVEKLELLVLDLDGGSLERVAVVSNQLLPVSRGSSGDTCQVIVDKYKTFTLAQFYAWNPAVGNACETLWMGYDVCIEVKGAAAATTTKPAVPVQSGVASKCEFPPPPPFFAGWWLGV